MYEEYFRFAASPFRLNPDPKFFFGSRSHNKAMAYLHYGLRQAEGFIVITGEIGAGKSMLIGHLIDQLDRSNVIAANLLTTNLEPSALLSHVLSAFRIEPAGSGESAAIEAFEDFLFDQMNRGRRVLLIVDEAQNLPIRTIEELRMLSNMDYDGTPLFQVFLVGQPEFRAMLSKPDMEQFRQRIIASYHLEPLSADETKDYIRHRLAVVGWAGDNPTISDDSFMAIYKVTGGVPRKINKLCNRVFLYCSIEKRNGIDMSVVKTVVTDLKQDSIDSVETSGLAKADEAPPLKSKKAQEAAAASPRAPSSEREPRKMAVGENGPSAPDTGKANAGPRAPVVIPFDAVRKIAAADKEQSAKPAAAEAPKGKGGKGAAPASARVEPDSAAEDAKRVSNEPKHPSNQSAPKRDGEAGVEPANIPARKLAQSDKGEAVRGAQIDGPSTTPVEGQMSVLDRLRGRRNEESGTGGREDQGDAPRPATLRDVAKAIAEVAATTAVGDVAKGAALNVADAGAADWAPTIGEPPIDEDPKGWRQTVVRSITETRDDLKAAHSNVSRLRRQLSDVDKRRREKRQRIAANLTRAESLLSEIRNAWR